MSKPRFSVIVPTCNRTAELRRCLERLEAQAFDRASFEIIVADDGDSGAPLVEHEFPKVRAVAGPRRGPAANRNCGARAAAGEWLVFIDDDCLPDSGMLAAYAAAIDAGSGPGVLEGRTYVDRPKASLCEVAPLNETGGRLWSCNFAIERLLFFKTSGFDERFPYAAMEDMDFCRRLESAGLRPEFVPGASVCHPWRRVTTWTPFRKQIESTLLYLELHPGEKKYLNPPHYAKVLARRFVECSVPALFKADFAGLRYQLLDHLHSLVMIGRLLFNDKSHARPDRT